MTETEVDRFNGTPFTVTRPNSIPMQFCNPELANTEVEIVVTDESGNDPRLCFEQLDANGCCTKNFSVPAGWLSAVFTHSSSADHAVIVGD